MDARVYHLGYNAGGAEQQIKALMSDPRMLLIDTRKSPKTWDPGWCKDDTTVGSCVIPGLQSQWAERYKWAGQVLGDRNYWYRDASVDIVALERGVCQLVWYLRHGHPLILLYHSEEACFVIMKALKAAMPEVTICSADGKPEREIA